MNASFGRLQGVGSLPNSFSSYIYEIAEEKKKIDMFIQSGDFPITPL
jgi:hypothetical protein